MGDQSISNQNHDILADMDSASTAKLALLFVSFGLCANAAQKFNVTIINREDNQSSYSFVVPGSSQTNTNANANCAGNANIASCNGSATSTTINRPAQARSYVVTGATLSLQLPDGRIAVVNCASKTNWTQPGRGPRRSCRVPLVEHIEAEFDGDNAKIKWVVSIDGKKLQDETYKILAVLDKP